MPRKPQPFFLFYIGSTKLAAVKVKPADGAFFDIVNFHETSPTGFEKGNVIHTERAVHDIRRLASQIGSQADFLKLPIHVVIESALTSTYSLSSSIYFQNIKRIFASDVEKVIEQTRKVATLPVGEQLILAAPQNFIVNDLDGIENPVGLEGIRLGVDLLLGTLARDVWKRLGQVFRQNSLQISSIIPKGVAGAMGLLTVDEKKGSTLFLDVGGKLAALVYVRKERVRRTSWLSFGGENWTERVMQSFGLNQKEARRIKETFGTVHLEHEHRDEIIPRSGSSVSTATAGITRKDLSPLMKEGMKDFLELVALELDRIEKVESPVDQIVVAGGGARLDGFLENLQSHFQKRVRLAQPLRIRTPAGQLIQPQYASFLGALRFMDEEARKSEMRREGEGWLARNVKLLRDWVREYF